MSAPQTILVKSKGSTTVASATRNDCAMSSCAAVPETPQTTSQNQPAGSGHVQKNKAGISDSGDISSTMYAVMVTALSVRESTLMITSVKPHTAAEPSVSNDPVSTG